MIVDRLENGLAAAQQRDVLRHEIEVVAVGMERGDLVLRAAHAVERVVVIEADIGHPLGAPHEGGGRAHAEKDRCGDQ